MRRLTTVAMGALLLASSARADDVLAPAHVRSPFWEAARNPKAQRVDTLLRQGRAQLYPAMGLGLLLGADLSAHRRTAIENALARFERARAIAPRDPEVLYLTGKALALWERRSMGGQRDRKNDDAIARFLELRAVDPYYEAEDVAFELGVLYTRKGDFARAADEYQRALALRIEDTSRSVLLGNLAEVTMMAGNLEHAVELYQQAIAEGSPDERLLPLWGLAVALDRLGERGEALEHAIRALREDQRPMGVLKQSSVFFVPPYEAHYYDGMGLLAMAELATEGGKAEHLARGYARVLEGAASPSALFALKQTLTSLDEEGHRALAAPLYEVVERALKRYKRPDKATRALLEEGALERGDVKVILYSVQALRAFARYLDTGGAQGPWADDARAHLQEISGWFTPKKPAPR